MKYIEIEDKVYENTIRFYFAPSAESLQRGLKWVDYTKDQDFSEMEGCTISGDCKYLVYLKKKNDDPVLVHEIYHLVDFIAAVTEVTDIEARAYLAQFFFREVKNRV